MQANQGSLGMIRVGDRVQFAQVIPATTADPILYLADYPGGQVTFNLDGAKRFRSQGFRLALVGASGAGKSNTLAVVAEEAHRIGYPFLVFDQEGEFTSLGDLPGVEVFTADGDCFDFVAPARFVLAHGGGAVVDASELFLDEQRRIYADLARSFYHLAGQARRRCFWLVDEASEVAPQRRAKGAEESLRWTVQIVRRGRKRGIYSVLATQRPSALSKDALAQFNVKMIGRLDIWQDLEAVKPYLTRRVDMTEISELASGQFLLDLSGVSQVVQARRRRSRDLGGTPTS